MNRKQQVIAIYFFILSLLISSCTNAPALSPTVAPTPIPSLTATPVPAPTFTPTATPLPVLPLLADTPLPEISNTISVSNTENIVEIARWKIRGWEEVRSIAFSPDDKTLAAGSADGTVQLWDVASGHHFADLSEQIVFPVYSVAFSPDGTMLASGDQGNVDYFETIKLWDVASGKEVRTLSLLTFEEDGRTDSVYSVAFSPDGKTLASGSYAGTVKLWDVASGEELSTLLSVSTDTGGAYSGWYTVYSVAFSPDGKILASAGGVDGKVKFWDVTSGTLLRTLNGSTDAIAVAFSPDGKILASGEEAGIKLWDVASGKELYTLSDHNMGLSFTFSPDGQMLAATGSISIGTEIGRSPGDGAVVLWDVTSGEKLSILPHGDDTFFVLSVTFSPDGKFIASSADDGQVHLWGIYP